jgi:hypothetical protein
MRVIAAARQAADRSIDLQLASSSSSPVLRGRIQEGERRKDDLSADEIMI